jgi:5'-methylthioadenosine nucleosidase
MLVLVLCQEGKLSTGNSLDMTPQDEEIIKANDATIKDMEVS